MVELYKVSGQSGRSEGVASKYFQEGSSVIAKDFVLDNDEIGNISFLGY